MLGIGGLGDLCFFYGRQCAWGYANWRRRCWRDICEGCRTEIVDVEHFDYGILGRSYEAIQGSSWDWQYIRLETEVTMVSCREP